MSTELEKRLAEAFCHVAAGIPVDRLGGYLDMADECARIAAEEIEKAVLAESLFGERETKRLNDLDAAQLRMDAARLVRDQFIAKRGYRDSDYYGDEWLAKIIGADSHEGGEEVSGGAGNINYRPGIKDTATSSGKPNDPAQKAAPPRPDHRDNGELCHRCGKRYLTVYSVPDDVWERIKPIGDGPGAGLLCPECADYLARVSNIPIAWVAVHGTTPIIEFTPQLIWRHSCDACGPLRHAVEEAIASWNQRTAASRAAGSSSESEVGDGHCRDMHHAALDARAEAFEECLRLTKKRQQEVSDMAIDGCPEITFDALLDAMREAAGFKVDP